MTYLGDGISTDEDFEDDTEREEGGVATPPPAEEGTSDGDEPSGNPDEA